MNKREFMQQAWIHITKRLPADDPYSQVLVYNSKNGYMGVWFSNEALDYANIMLAGDETNMLSWDRQFTHWMPLFEPENMITWRKYQAQNKRSKK